MFKLKIGDQVVVTTGRDKGKKGKIEKVHAGENKVVVNGINIYKRHKKVTRNQAAGIYEITRPINAGKVSLICPKCSKPTRVGFVINQKTKSRVCKHCKGVI